jgi:hypothetical protein
MGRVLPSGVLFGGASDATGAGALVGFEDLSTMGNGLLPGVTGMGGAAASSAHPVDASVAQLALVCKGNNDMSSSRAPAQSGQKLTWTTPLLSW